MEPPSEMDAVLQNLPLRIGAYVPDDLLVAGRGLAPARERQRHRHAHDDDEEREYQIRERAAVPGGVRQWRQNRVPVARVVDDDHRGDGDAAKHVEGRQPGVRGHWRGGLRRYDPIAASVATFSPSHQHSGGDFGSPSMNSSLSRAKPVMKRPIICI